MERSSADVISTRQSEVDRPVARILPAVVTKIAHIENNTVTSLKKPEVESGKVEKPTSIIDHTDVCTCILYRVGI